MRANQTVSGFIQLDRTFHELSQAAESDDSDLRPRFGTEHLSWPDLIPEYRVVILSEAGSGKTEEIQYVARSLRLEGKRAFFIRLEHLARELEIAFEEGTVEEFQAWLASGDEGWLLLDSVDEARLRDPRDFEAAVLRLGRILSSSKQRAHIVITGRTTAWRPQTDLALCEKHLPFARSDVSASVEPVESELDEELNTETAPQEREGPFRIVALDDLSARQIEVFARAKGVADTKALLDAVERADAWSFTSRPQDLEELVEFWKDHGRIGSRLHLMQNSIDRRLKERNQDRAEARPLSVERARVGAKLLAAASTMAQEPTIRVPDGTSNMKGLPVAPILPDWNDVDLATLLARPIFDEAIYGTVRFHHRTVREYLTAEWFADLLKRRTSRRRIEQLFFRVQYGLEVIVPTMRPILPWLAILHEGIRDRVRRTAPEVLLEGGDPSQLPLEIRRQILHQVCDQIASGVSKRTMTDYAVVQRFASADLTADIKGLINAHAANDDLLWFLLRMVWQGQLAGALPEAKQIALSRSSSRYPRIAAFRAVAALGSAEDKAEIRRRFLEESRRVDRHWLAELLEDCEPSVETVEWLFKCLSKAGGKDPHNVDYLAQELTAFAREMEHSLLPLFLEQTNGLLARRPVVERRHCEISTRFSWLLRPAGIAVQRLVEARDPAALQLPALAILHKIPIFQQYDGIEFSGLKLVLDELVPQWPDLNFSLFWYLVREERRWCDRKKKERIIDWWRANVAGSYVQFGPKGFHSVLSEIGARPFTDDKLIALSLAFRLYVNGGRPKEWRKLLKKAVGENAVLSTRLSEFMRPPPQSPEMKEHKRREAQWKRRYEKRQQRDQRHHQDWRRYVNEHVDALRNPGLKSPDDISRAQWHLHERMREMDHEPTHWTKGNWEVLKEEYGDSVARAFRDGVVAYWRRHKPTLVSEGAPNNSIPFSTIFGLTGLTIEAREIQEWATTLSEADAELAFRYAMRELNGFPAWFSGLFERFSETVVKMALDEIQYELLGKYKSDQGSYILHDISWRGNWLWDAIAPALCGMVASEEPENVTSLRDLLSIIHGSSVPDDEIALLASDKCASLTRLDHVAHWFASWVGVAPESAIPALERHLASITDEKERAKSAMIFVTQLLGGRRGVRSRTREAFRTAKHLKSLYLLMHRYIRRKEDLERAGKGVFSPELRDDAQEARDQLFALLEEIPGKEAFLAMQEIARSHPDQRSRPWFALHAKTKAELDADAQPWSSSQVREFHQELERTPTNHRDLFDLAVMRFLDLKDELEEGDSSVASILLKVEEEVEIRKFIGNWCREWAQGRYAVPQEEELADAKKPDLRWHGVGFDAPLPIELKIADKWTGPALFERLEVQLCGDYLRDARSGCGIFMLVYRGKKKKWELPGAGQSVEFEGLIQALQAHWFQISGRHPRVDEIRVIGIDLIKRAQPCACSAAAEAV